MKAQTVALLLCLAAQAATGLCFRALARFLYSGLLSPGPIWPVRHVCPVIQVPTAQWRQIGLQLGLTSIVAVRSADVDLSVNFTHADPAQLPVPNAQDVVTL